MARAAASRIINDGPTDRLIEVTSFAELVLAPEAADNAHPAFSKMFVETEISPSGNVDLRAAAQARAGRARHRSGAFRHRSVRRRARRRGRDRPPRLHRPRPHHRRCRGLRSRRQARRQSRLHARPGHGAAPPRPRAGQQEGVADLLDHRRRRTAPRSRRPSAGSTIPRASRARRCSPGRAPRCRPAMWASASPMPPTCRGSRAT